MLQTESGDSPPRPAPMAVRPIYAIEALSSTGGTLFTAGIFFYTVHRFGWGLADNFKLAAVQGLIYVGGALSAHALSRRLSPVLATMALHAVMAALCAVGVFAGLADARAAVVAVLLGYTFACAAAWPILESLVATHTGATALARRLAVYNMVWPAVAVATVAVSGVVIESFPIGVFLLPGLAHVAGLAIATKIGPDPRAADFGPQGESHPTPEPELVRLRTVALWVSRLGLPATYAVIYGLMPLMPSLPSVARLDTAAQTVVSSAWLAGRWLTFAALALHPWWHTRPRAMVLAAVAMLAAFVGITVPPSQWGGGASAGVDLAAILFWQLVLGAALGMIYSGSLYFGMVLSEGSTEHSGYHEALIGLGWALGPGAGVLAGGLLPGDTMAGVTAVGLVIAASVLCVLGAAVIASRRRATVDRA